MAVSGALALSGEVEGSRRDVESWMRRLLPPPSRTLEGERDEGRRRERGMKDAGGRGDG